MPGELTNLGDSAVEAWNARDRELEAVLEADATMLERVEAAVSASKLFPQMAAALHEVLLQYEHGAIALLMQLSALAADAGRRIVEAVCFTAFLKHNPLKIDGKLGGFADWQSGGALFSFLGPLKTYFDAPSRAKAAVGPFGKPFIEALYRELSRSVHGNPVSWGESREGLKVKVEAPTSEIRQRQLMSAAKVAMYVTLIELPDLWIADVASFFGSDWKSVQAALELP